jgi:hypothetical protein
MAFQSDTWISLLFHQVIYRRSINILEIRMRPDGGVSVYCVDMKESEYRSFLKKYSKSQEDVFFQRGRVLSDLILFIINMEEMPRTFQSDTWLSLLFHQVINYKRHSIIINILETRMCSYGGGQCVSVYVKESEYRSFFFFQIF